MKKFISILLAVFGLVSQSVYAQSCNLTVDTTSVTCFGGSDGKAEIWKDGKLIVFGNNNNGNPATCATPSTSPYSCGSPVTGSIISNATSGVVEIPDGKTLYLTSSLFEGSIRFKGTNTLVVCGEARIQNFEMNNNSKPIKIVINGQAVFSSSNLNLDGLSVVDNYGTLNCPNSIGFNGKLNNHGTVNAAGFLNVNPSGQMYNAGTIIVNGNYNNNNLATNAGYMEVSGIFHNNGGSGFKNLCTIKIGAQFMNSTTMENYGKMIGIGNDIGNLNIGGSGIYKAYAGSLLKVKDVTMDGVIDGLGATCAAVKVSGYSLIHGIIRNKVDYCDANGIETNTGQVLNGATTNCSCTANGSGAGETGTVTWNSFGYGTSILGGSTITGLPSGSYTVSVSLQGCSTQVLNFTIGSPLKITATVSVSGTTATVSNVKGGRGGYTYEWTKLSDLTKSTTTDPFKTFSVSGDYTVIVKDSKGCASDPKQFTISGGSTCNFTVITTPATCFGGKDGTVTIYKDGQPLDYNGDGNNNNTDNTSEPTGDPASCVKPSVSPYTCSAPPTGAIINSQSSGSVSVSTGQLVFLTSAFTGDLVVDGGTLVVCGNATIQNFNYAQQNTPAFTLVVNGTAELNAPNLNLKENSTVKNYGVLNTKSIGFNGSLENHGTLTVDGDLSFNTSGNTYLNTGTITVNTNFNNKMATTNGGYFTVKGTFNNNEPTSYFNNLCRLKVEGALNNNKFIDNKGYIIVSTNKTTFNSNSYYKGYAGSVLYTQDFANNGTIEGINSCASIRVKLENKLNSTSILKGFVYVCDASVSSTDASTGSVLAPASLSCNCGGIPSTQGPILWVGYPGSKNSVLTGVGVGSGTVTITWPGCNSVTLTYTVGGPTTAITATLTNNCPTVTVSNPSGGNTGTYTYKWGPDSLATNLGTRTYDRNGSYSVRVVDSKGCKGPTLPFSIGCITDSICETVVDYRADGKVLVKIECPGTCDYQIRKADGILLPYGSLVKRPCKDSVIVSVDCHGRETMTEIKGSGNCEKVCNPAVETCPCDVSKDPDCPQVGGCIPTVDIPCDCIKGKDPNCPYGCDKEDPLKCPCDPKVATCDTTVLKLTYNSSPPKCSEFGSAVATIKNGSGSYTVYNNKNTGSQQVGTAPFTLYNLPVGITMVTVVDNQTKLSKEFFVEVLAAPDINTSISVSAATDPQCKNLVTVTVTNANAGPYSVDFGCCAAGNMTNLNPSNGVLTVGPYPIAQDRGDGPFVIKVTDANCTTADELVTKCNCEITTPQAQSFVPSFTPIPPSHKGKKDGSITLNNLPANTTAYWIGKGLYSVVQGTTLSGVGAGRYRLLIIDNASKCKYYYSINPYVLKDGPEFVVKYTLLGGCNYEASLIMRDAQGNIVTTPAIPQPITFTWHDHTTGNVLATGKQINLSALAPATLLALEYITLKVSDGQNNKATFTFYIPKSCKPQPPCSTTVRYSHRDPICKGGNTGEISIKSLAPSGSSIAWITPALQATGISSWEKGMLSAGKYSFSLRNPNPICPVEKVSVYLIDPPALVVKQENIPTGGVRLTIENGKPNYTFVWSDNVTETNKAFSERTNLTPGVSYTVTVTDANNCGVVYPFTYNPCAQNPVTAVASYSVKPNNDKVTSIIPTGGYLPYTYLWNDNTLANTAAASQVNLPTNKDYQVKVTDIRGCTTVVNIPKGNCDLEATFVTTATAYSDECNGTATFTLKQGGVSITDFSAWTIKWDEEDIEHQLTLNGLSVFKANSQIKITNACAGTHKVYILSPQNCGVEMTFTIPKGPDKPKTCTSPITITPYEGSTYAKKCFNDVVNINFSVQGGSLPYRYTWKKTYNAVDTYYKSDKPGFSKAQAGTYIVTVADADSICVASATFTVTGPDAALSLTPTPVSPACVGKNGSATLSITGGKSPYTTVWTKQSNGSAAVPTNLIPDTLYKVKVTDVLGCKDSITVKVNPVYFNGRIYTSADSLCPGKSLTLTARNATGYTIEWSSVPAGGVPAAQKNQDRIVINTIGIYKLTYKPITVVAGCDNIERKDTIAWKKNCTPIINICDNEVFTAQIDLPPAEDQCVTHKNYVATVNAMNTYKIYIEQAKQDFKLAYKQAVMGSLSEKLTKKYSDHEGHYTLYYYDQAGNLVRTVPPAGVVPLDTATTNLAIKKMKAGAEERIFTEHTLATTYSYNSLNQMVSQDLPDHNQQDLWETNPALTLNGQTVGAIDYVNSSKGLLFANQTDQTQLYTTSNAGQSWNASLGLQFGNILDVYQVTTGTPTYYAVGEKGLFLIGSNSGADWHLSASPTTEDLIHVYFNNTTPAQGRIMEKNGKIWTTSTSGVSWSASPLTSLSGVNLQSIQDVWSEGDNILVSGTLNNASVLYLSMDGGNTFNQQYFTAFPYGATTKTATDVLVAGANGLLLKVQSDGKILKQSQTNLTGLVRQLEFGTNTYAALVVADAYNPQGNLYTSTDGLQWTQATTNNSVLGISKLADGSLTAVTGNTYANSSNWSSFATPVVTVPAGGSTMTPYNFTKTVSVTGNLLSYGTPTPTVISNREVLVGGTLAYRTSATAWQQVVITNYYQTVRSLHVRGANDWLVIGTDNNLYRTTQGTGLNTLALTNNGAVQLGGAYELYPVGSDLYILRASGAIEKLTVNTNSVSTTAVYSLPEGDAYNFQSLLLEPAATTGIKATVTLKNGKVFTKASSNASDAWIERTYQLQPASLQTVAQLNAQTLYTAGTQGELFKSDFNNNSTPNRWRYEPVSNATINYTDIGVDGTSLRLAAQPAKFFSYNTATKVLSAENELNGEVVNEVYVNLAATQSGKIFGRTAGTWNLVYDNLGTGAITDIYASLAAGPQQLYFLQNTVWMKANATKIRPIQALATSGNTAIAVGNQGTVLRSTDQGTTWQPRSVRSTDVLSTVGIVGSSALIGSTTGNLYYSTNTGDTWTAVSGLTGSGPIRAIAMPSSTSVWVVRGNQVLYSSNLTTYAAVITVTGQQLYSIHMDAQGYGYVVGDAGTAYRIQPTSTFTATQIGTGTLQPINNGTTLSALIIPTDSDITDDKGTGVPIRALRSVTFTDRLTGYITGTSGLVLKTVDGGFRWKPEGPGSGSSTPMIAMATAQNGTLVNGNGEVLSLRDRAQQLGTRYWYDELGRLTITQNSKQYNIEKYLLQQQYQGVTVPGTGKIRSYYVTLYDRVGRIASTFELLTRKEPLTYKNESKVKYDQVVPDFVLGGYKLQITNTYFDEPKFENILSGFEQLNLRPLIASVTYQEKEGLAYDRATHYSYDFHKNINTVVQEIKVGSTKVVKRIDYDYDLNSGKLNYVYYQKGQADQLTHQYEYDGDNRMVSVKTSRDGIHWLKDATYKYYGHENIAKMELGEHQVETQNYAFTVHGWNKAVLGNNFSYALTYFNDGTHKDYEAIGSVGTPAVSVNTQVSKSLYNNNIAASTVLNNKLSTTAYTEQYEYDQLNRLLKSSRVGATQKNFSTRYSYDGNTNLKELSRHDKDGVKFDSLKYNYETKAAGFLVNTNRLRYVSDRVLNSPYENDLENQSTDNYVYDEVGNVIYDDLDGSEVIEYNASQKIRYLKRRNTSSKPDVEFVYDANLKSRVAKIVRYKNGTVKTTYYINDAAGNPLAIYKQENGGSVQLSEQYIYGEQRLGTINGKIVANEGNREYELKDHLESVRATVNDLPNNAGQVSVQNAFDYYPYGMLASVYSNPDKYRYGYNGWERDDDLEKGDGNEYSTEYRQYDSRVGRFASVDPLVVALPAHSPYAYALGNPIRFLDENGDWPGKPSAALEKVGVSLPPLAAGLIDGLADGSPIGTVGMAWDILTDSKFREEMINAFVEIAKDPVGFLGAMFTEYKDLLERVATGKATPEDMKRIGEEIGSSIAGALTGSAMNKIFGKVKAFKKMKLDAGAAKKKVPDAKAKSPMFECVSCFTALTKVETKKGLKDIKEIVVGDSVLSFDEQSGKLSYQRVSSRYEKYRDTIVVVYAMGTFIETTNDHPFFVSGEWLRAHELKAGMSLTLASGETTIIEKVELKLQRTLVYNFSVENNHTYTVGNHKFLVHNCPPLPGELEVGQYKKLAKVGDDMTPDHIPSFASVKANKEKALGRKLSKAEEIKLRQETITLQLKTVVHKADSRTYGGRNTPQQIELDSKDLRAAAQKDMDALKPRLKQEGFSDSEIQAAFDKVHAQNVASGLYK